MMMMMVVVVLVLVLVLVVGIMRVGRRCVSMEIVRLRVVHGTRRPRR
jgi:hypothetical protein